MLNFTHLVICQRQFLFILLSFGAAWAQPRVGFVEVYGAQKVSKEKILKAVNVKPGDPLPKSKGDVEEKVEAVDGIVSARLEAYCCDEGKPILYVGVEERGAPTYRPRTVLEEELTLPEEIVQVYAEFSSALSRAVSAGDTEEDLSAGHSLMKNLPCRVLQERFVGLAELHIERLHRVMISAADHEQRAIAAYVIGYAPDKASLVPDLQQAVQDPAESVRANATRSLRAIAVYAKEADPALKLKVQPTWFVEMLNSVSLSDRLEGAKALLFFMQDKPDDAIIGQLKDRALPSLIETAKWKHLDHALPAFMVLGRILGQDEIALMRMWVQDREKAVSDFQKQLKKKN